MNFCFLYKMPVICLQFKVISTSLILFLYKKLHFDVCISHFPKKLKYCIKLNKMKYS